MNADYQDLPDELNQSKDNGDLAEEGEEDDQQVKITGLKLVFEMDWTIFGTELFLDCCEIANNRRKEVGWWME